MVVFLICPLNLVVFDKISSVDSAILSSCGGLFPKCSHTRALSATEQTEWRLRSLRGVNQTCAVLISSKKAKVIERSESDEELLEELLGAGSQEIEVNIKSDDCKKDVSDAELQEFVNSHLVAPAQIYVTGAGDKDGIVQWVGAICWRGGEIGFGVSAGLRTCQSSR